MQKIEDCESKEEIFSLTPTHERHEPINDCILGSECIACGIFVPVYVAKLVYDSAFVLRFPQ